MIGLLRFLFLCAVLGVGTFLFFHWKHLVSLPDLRSLERYEPIEAIQIFDRNDHLAATVEGVPVDFETALGEAQTFVQRIDANR